MRIEIYTPDAICSSESCKMRALLFNDGYEPIVISRNAFVGPNLRRHPESVEPTYGDSEEPFTLQPFTFYGREREFSGLDPGEEEVSAYYRPGKGTTEIRAERRMRVEAGYEL
jgi:hypothetical protein